MDDDGKRTFLELFREVAPRVPGAPEPVPVVGVRRCAFHPYGLDYEVAFKDGSCSFQRDIDLVYMPGGRERLASFWLKSPRSFTREELAQLSQLPQYAWAEGDFLGPLWRRAVSAGPRLGYAYI